MVYTLGRWTAEEKAALVQVLLNKTNFEGLTQTATRDAILDAIIAVQGSNNTALESQRVEFSALITEIESALNANLNEIARVENAAAAARLELSNALAAEIAQTDGEVVSLGQRIDTMLSNTDAAAIDSIAELLAHVNSVDGDLADAITAMGTGSNSALNDHITAYNLKVTELTNTIAANKVIASDEIARLEQLINNHKTEATTRNTLVDGELQAIKDDIVSKSGEQTQALSDATVALDSKITTAKAAAIEAAKQERLTSEGVINQTINTLETKVDQQKTDLEDQISTALSSMGLNDTELTGKIELINKTLNDNLDNDTFSVLENLDALADEMNNRQTVIAGVASVTAGIVSGLPFTTATDYEVVVSPVGHVPAFISVEKIDGASFKVNAKDARYFAEDNVDYTAAFNVSYQLVFKPADIAREMTLSDGTGAGVVGAGTGEAGA